MAEVLNVERRSELGKRKTRRLRASGIVPAVLYGHKQEVIPLSVQAEQLESAIRHGSRFVRLDGAVTEDALIREVQWDTWGTHILHVDFARVSSHERVTVRLPVELRGEAPGVKEGGTVELLVHEVEIECEATQVSDRVEVNINQLQLGQSITVGEIPLPEGFRMLGDPEEVIVHCVARAAEAEEELEAPAEKGEEPEVISRKAAGEEDQED